MPPAYYQDVAGIIVVALGKCCIASVPKRNREIPGRETSFRRGAGRAAFGMPFGNNAVQTDALLIHLVQYGQCHMEFEYTEQGEVYMVVIPEHVSFVCPYGYTNGGCH